MSDLAATEEDEEGYNLSDLSVQTVGLVQRGAVSLGTEPGKNFFLLKSEEPMGEDELEIEEVVEDPDVANPTESPVEDFTEEETSLLKRFTGLFKSKTPTTKNTKALALAAKMLNEGGYPTNAKKLAAFFASPADDEDAEAMPAKAKKAKPNPFAAQPDDTKDKPPMTKSDVIPAVVESVMKAQITAMENAFKAEREALAKSIQDAAEAKYEATIKDLQFRVEKSEVEKAAETELREKREYLEKAMTLRALPVPTTQLADVLYKSSKAMSPEDFALLETTLAASDNILGAASIFSEYGYTGSVEEMTLTQEAEAIAKSDNIPLDQAILKLSPVKQIQLMKEMGVTA